MSLSARQAPSPAGGTAAPWAGRTPPAGSLADRAPARAPGQEQAGRSGPSGIVPRSASLRITESPQGFAQAREFTRRTLGSWALGDRSDDAVLVVTELATNAVLHAADQTPAGQTGVWLKLTLRRAHLVCAVTDQSESPPLCPRTDGALEVHGRGLRIVEALSEHWGWTRSPAGKTVWAMLSAPPRPTSPAWQGPA
ncbi:ATP-binding protein [Streptomyces sp. NPDC059466]|uniref:ATP-binding protein n=1 Tax=unclassified Streptomyces TaxID=2593676 RepID=UPI0036D1C9C2